MGSSLTRDFKRRIAEYRRRMDVLQRRIDASSVIEFTKGQKRYFEVLNQQEVFWKRGKIILA